MFRCAKRSATPAAEVPGRARAPERLLWRLIASVDALANRLYGWRYNPLYQSGSLVVALLAVVLVTGIYLLIFYRIGAPYESVAGITAQVWLGRWIRTLHRYASDAAIVAAAIHAFRMFAQGRSWGPRALAWITGIILFASILFSGVTGYVMIWDIQAQVLAVEGARFLDQLPIFAEPISRAFTGETDVPRAFFFLNLFLHVAVPIGLGILLWLHVSRVARAVLLPPKKLMWGVIGLLLVASVVWPAVMAPKADLFRLPGAAPYDVFYVFWLPLTRALSPGIGWAAILATFLAFVLIPIWTRPRADERAASSVVDERVCTGCEQCYLDCPYEAIAMIAAPGGRVEAVARVDPALCVSCGICAGSCAPMRVGPPLRTGRDQLSQAKRWFTAAEIEATDDIVLIACEQSAIRQQGTERFAGAAVYPVACAGAVHTSVLEYFMRGGAAGVLVAACPPRDCWNREGPKWARERMYEDREAELQPRVDKDRVRLVYAGWAEVGRLRDEVRRFAEELKGASAAEEEAELDLIRMCETPEREVAS